MIKEAVKHPQPLIGIEKLKNEIRSLKEELKAAQKASRQSLKETRVGDAVLVVDTIEAGDIKSLVDELKNRHDKVAVMLFQERGEKVLLAAGVKGVAIDAGKWVKQIAPIVGGGGGGRSDFAQAGGKEPAKINEAIEAAVAYAKEALGA